MVPGTRKGQCTAPLGNEAHFCFGLYWLSPGVPEGLSKDFLQIQPGQECPALAQEKPRAWAGNWRRRWDVWGQWVSGEEWGALLELSFFLPSSPSFQMEPGKK